MAIYTLTGTFSDAYSDTNIINLTVSSGTIQPTSATKLELENGLQVTCDEGVTITVEASNGTCSFVTSEIQSPVPVQPDTSLKPLFMGGIGGTNEGAACYSVSQDTFYPPFNYTVYHDGTGDLPVVGDTVYQKQGNNSPEIFNSGNSNWYSVSNTTNTPTTYTIKIGAGQLGNVLEVYQCPSIEEPTTPGAYSKGTQTYLHDSSTNLTPSIDCGETVTAQRNYYHSGTNLLPEVGDKVYWYADDNMYGYGFEIPFPLSPRKWVRLSETSNGPSAYSIYFDSTDGIVTHKVACSSGLTQLRHEGLSNTDPTEACNIAPSSLSANGLTLFHDGAGDLPVVGDKMYLRDGNQPVSGFANPASYYTVGSYNIVDGLITSAAIKTDADGYVTEAITCSNE